MLIPDEPEKIDPKLLTVYEDTKQGLHGILRMIESRGPSPKEAFDVLVRMVVTVGFSSYKKNIEATCDKFQRLICETIATHLAVDHVKGEKKAKGEDVSEATPSVVKEINKVLEAAKFKVEKKMQAKPKQDESYPFMRTDNPENN